jgi:hypothetical protein
VLMPLVGRQEPGVIYKMEPLSLNMFRALVQHAVNQMVGRSTRSAAHARLWPIEVGSDVHVNLRAGPYLGSV